MLTVSTPLVPPLGSGTTTDSGPCAFSVWTRIPSNLNTSSAVEKALALADQVGNQSPSSVAACKGLIQAARTGNMADAYRIERQSFVGLFDTADQAEGVNAFLEKRKPDWKNA